MSNILYQYNGICHRFVPCHVYRFLKEKEEHHTDLQVFLRHFIPMPEAGDTWEKRVLIFLLGVTLF